MNWLYYLLESSLYISLFYGFYAALLQKETFYTLNRWYILISTLLSFILPLLQLGVLKTPLIQNALVINSHHLRSTASFPVLLYLYFAGMLFFLSQLIKNTYHLLKKAAKCTKQQYKGYALLEIQDEITAFSFFNLIFIHPQLRQQAAVLKHEMIHIRQKHSLDILLLETVHVLCWFNPLLFLIKKEIKIIHEYIADELTTKEDIPKHDYALLLIHNSMGLRKNPICNPIFNPSILKRRIHMLNKNKTASGARLRILLSLPLIGGMVCLSTKAFSKDYGYFDLLPAAKTQVAAPQQTVPPPPREPKPKTDQIKFPPPVVKPDKKTDVKITPPPGN